MKLQLRENLRQLQGRLRSRAVLAIQLKSDSLAITLVRFENEVFQNVQSLSVPFGSDAMAADPEKAGQELASLLREAGLREKRCVVCIPPGWALSTSTEVPEISADDVRNYLELRAEREFPISIAELRLAHCSFVLPDGTRRATIAAVPAKRLAPVERSLEVAGCKLVSLSLGLDRFVPSVAAPAAMHFLANGNHVDLVIAAGGGIAALRSLAGAVAQDESAFDAAGFCREVRITLGGLPDSVRQQVREVHFAGPPTTAELLCLKTRDHLRRMGVDPATVERRSDGAGSAVEAANQYLQGDRVTFEFLPPPERRWQALLEKVDSRRRRIMVAGVLLLIVLPIAAFIVRSKIEGNLKTRWNGMEQDVADLEALQKQIRQYRPWFDSNPENLVLMEGLMSAFPEPGDAWAKSIQIADGAKVTCTGFARNNASFLSLLDHFRSRPEISDLQLLQQRAEKDSIQFTLSFKWDPSHGNAN